MKRFCWPALLLLSACTAPSSWMGIALDPGYGGSEINLLAARARQGDKLAQLDLGKRFEAGDGLTADEKRARQLYRLAATDSGGTIFVYSPPVGKHGKGQVIPVNLGPRVAGLAEAKDRLRALKARSR